MVKELCKSWCYFMNVWLLSFVFHTNSFCIHNQTNVIFESKGVIHNSIANINFIPVTSPSLNSIRSLNYSSKSTETISFLDNKYHFLLEELKLESDIKHGTNDITSMKLFHNKVLNKYEKEYDIIFVKVLADVLEYIMRKTSVEVISIITDVTFDHSVGDSLVEELRKKKFYVSIRYNRIIGGSVADIDFNLQDIVYQSISFVFLLLPWELADTVLAIAERNNIRTRKSTWLTLNSMQVLSKYNCIHNIDIRNLMDASQIQEWIEHSCANSTYNFTMEEKVFHELIGEIVHDILHCTEHRDVLKVATLIDAPMVIETPSELNTLGEIVCVYSYPCSIPQKDSNGKVTWRESCCSGLNIDIMVHIAKRMEFDMNIYIVPDNQYGGYENSSWTGIVGEVFNGRADIGIQGLTPTVLRSEVVDFTYHFMLSGIGITYRSEERELPVINWVFLRTLEWDITVGLAVAFLIVLFFMFGYENLVKYLSKSSYYPTREAFSYIAGLTFQRDLAGKVPNKWSARIIAITYAIATTIIMTTYTANLTANNISKKSTGDFKGLSDPRIVNPTASFKFGLLRGSFIELFFQTHYDVTYRNIYNNFIVNYIQDSDDSGMKYVSTKQIDAYIGDYVYLQYKLVTPEFCSSMVLHKEKGKEGPISFAVPKSSPLKYKISRELRYLHENQKLEALVTKWFYLPDCLEEKAEAQAFTWQYMGGMLLAMGGFTLFSMFVNACETLYTSIKHKQI